jgi:NAD(P)-dependent dehydrogenase (short-subunit alcohol dehydrogenase family)
LERRAVGEPQFAGKHGQRRVGGDQPHDGDVAAKLVLDRLERTALGHEVALERADRHVQEWGRLNTTVNCVAFGLIRTRLTVSTADDAGTRIEGRDIKVGVNAELLAAMEQTIPLGRGGTPEEAAGAVYLFTLPEADYVSGQTLMCTGGLTGV